MRRFTIICFVLIGFAYSGLSQIEVETGVLTADEYVNEVLLGTGIAASNVSFTGSSVQIGHFTNGGAVGLEEGVILSSEHVGNVIIGGVGGTIPAGEDVSGEADLLTLAQSVPALIGQTFNVNSVNDVAILEFDFVPTGDTLSFNYVFGSDEWTNWINSSFNDIFGFFLAGPGITGTYGAPAGFPNGSINIAQVPDTDPPLPITISSVNNGNPDGSNCQYCEYYIYNNPNVDIAINAHTTVLTATSLVECGETYHIRLAIADGSDTALESIVLLEAGSFTSNSVVDVTLSTDVGGDTDIMFEDCGEATLTFTRPPISIIDVDEMVIMTYSGSAENGVDYTLLPDTIIIPGGVNSVSFELDAFEDGIDEGVENVIFEMLNIAGCNGSGLTTYFEFEIWDEPDPLVVNGWDAELCINDTLELVPEVLGGYGNFSYDWSSGGTAFSEFVSPAASTEYILTVSDTCGMLPDTAAFDITILIFDPLTVTLDPSDVELECGTSQNLLATAGGGEGTYEYYWYNQDGQNLFGWSNSFWVSTFTNAETVFVDVTDGCGYEATASATITVNVPELVVELEPVTEVSCNNEFTLAPTVIGGGTAYYYSWTVDGLWSGWQSTFSYATSEDVEICCNVSDNCGQDLLVCTEVVVVSPEIEIIMEESMTGSCITEFDILPTVNGGSGIFDFSWTDQMGEEIEDSQNLIGFQSDFTTVLNLSVSDNCGQSNEEDIDIIIVNPPLQVELGEDIDASCIDNTQVNSEIISGSGAYVYEWYVDGAMVGTQPSLTWQSFETVLLTLNVVDGCSGFDSDSVVINIPDIPLEIYVSNDTSICRQGQAVMNVQALGGEDGFTYYWPQLETFGQTVAVEPFSSSSYDVIATDICGKEIEENIMVEVQFVGALFTTTYLSETEVEFNSMPDPECPECDYLWDFGDGNTSIETDPTHQFDGLSEYQTVLYMENEIGCRDSAYTNIHAPVLLYVPNAFTPNNDGVNDFFKVEGSQLLRFEISVYNRWGERVYHSTDVDEIWTGAHQGGNYYVPNGTYTYVLEAKGMNSDGFKRSGTITVMR